jgi:hypothetical protein
MAAADGGQLGGAGGPAGYADASRSIVHRQWTRPQQQDEVSGRPGGASWLWSARISYRGANQPNTALDDPWQRHTRLFADQQRSQASGAPGRTAQRARLLEGRYRQLQARSPVRYADAAPRRLAQHRGTPPHQHSGSTPLTLPAKQNPRDGEPSDGGAAADGSAAGMLVI